nr:DUF6046 domain-containing protein [Parabacteroides goldsteinii]
MATKYTVKEVAQTFKRVSQFNLGDMLLNVIGYKGLPYPGGFIPDVPGKYKADGYEYPGEQVSEKTSSDFGSTLRKKDAEGRWYFMPIVLEHKGTEYEIPNAVISIRGKKSIVETAMVGRKGTVKELISVDDYEIRIAGVCLDVDFPDQQIGALNELYNINESVTLKCALTDIFLDEEDKVVIKSIDFAEMKGCETAQVFTMELVTDRSFELILE